MKRKLALLAMAGLLVVSTAACGSSGGDNGGSDKGGDKSTSDVANKDKP